jgi:GNAT superfamily N-acetyltransferase
MSELVLRLIAKEELETAIALEHSCYPPEAAATLAGFLFRYEHYHAYFWSLWLGEQLVGITNGIRTSQSACGDEMKGTQSDTQEGKNFCILTVAVAPDKRRQGFGRVLLKKLIKQCEANGIEKIILMCEEHLVSFYEGEQFKLHGVSSSSHGGIVWYEMSRTLHTMEHLA